MKIAIAISTYKRHDGKTPEYLKRALESVLNQSYQNYKIFLIGDQYDDVEEFNSFSKIIPKNQIYSENLSFAVERNKYKAKSRQLWCSGGVNAYNRAISLCLEQNFDFMCHLDHDDYWASDHLYKIKEVIEKHNNVACVYTCAQHINNKYLPNVPLSGNFYEHYPIPKNTIHSSVCLNHKLLPLKYRDVYAETGEILPADMDMWYRLKKYCEENKLKSYLVACLTCYHLNERH